MRRHFLRVYLALATVALLLVVVASAVLHRQFVHRVDGEIEAALEQPVERLRERLDYDRFRRHDHRRAFEELVQTRLGMPARVIPLRDIDFGTPDQRDRVMANEVVTVRTEGHRATVARLTDEVAVIIGPVPDRGNGRFILIQAVTFGALLLGLGIGVVISLRPLERRLSGIADVADALGDGAWDARAEVRGDAMDGVAQRFNTMAERVGAQVEEHRALLGAVSHELRTPLARLYLLLDDAADADTATRDRALERMDRSLSEMNEIVEELLAWARVDAGTLDRETVDLDALVASVRDGLGELADGIEVDARGAPESASIDVRGARHVLRNLMGNALRYARTRVEVRVTRAEDAVRIVVDDDGPGIPSEDRERVFEPFVTLDPARSNTRGAAGLGLAIVERVARAHGGRACCETAPLGGARFVVTLPAGTDDA